MHSKLLPVWQNCLCLCLSPGVACRTGPQWQPVAHFKIFSSGQ